MVEAKRQWGRWVEVQKIGSGAYGNAFLADTKSPYQTKTGFISRALIKELPTSVGHPDFAQQREALKTELIQLSELDHPRIVKVYEWDLTSNKPWVAMHYLNGDDLFAEVTQEGKLPEENWFNFARELFEALAYLEDKNVIHKDLHFKNVMHTYRGTFLIDFGLAMQSQRAADSIQGIPFFVAPEAHENSILTTKYDVFAAGSILYWAATGKIPFDDGVTESSYWIRPLENMLARTCDYSILSPQQQALVMKMHEIDVNKRASAKEILQILSIRKSAPGLIPNLSGMTKLNLKSIQETQVTKRRNRVVALRARRSGRELDYEIMREIHEEILTYMRGRERRSFLAKTAIGKIEIAFECYFKDSFIVLTLNSSVPIEANQAKRLNAKNWYLIDSENRVFEIMLDTKYSPRYTSLENIQIDVAGKIAAAIVLTLQSGVDGFENLTLRPIAQR